MHAQIHVLIVGGQLFPSKPDTLPNSRNCFRSFSFSLLSSYWGQETDQDAVVLSLETWVVRWIGPQGKGAG